MLSKSDFIKSKGCESIYHVCIYTRGWKDQSNYVKLLTCAIEAQYWSVIDSSSISCWGDTH